MKIYAVLVTYNKHLSDCSSFCSALKEPDVQLLVVDNSTDESIHNQEEARQAGAWFLSMNGNQGLSKAYNAAFDYLKTTTGDWVVLLDDDTQIPDQYWMQLRKETPNAVLLPVVRTMKGKMISPAEMKHDIPRSVVSPSTISDITGINSGMAVPKQLTDTYRYNDHLFLDFIDHQFIKDLKQNGVDIRILPAELVQSFSADGLEKQSALKRLEIQKKDLYTYYAANPWKAWYLIMKRKIRLAVQLRKPEVLLHG
ncbi:glycosyltransferase [Faecalibaculum rodentium]|uniref:glycosyltransferase n=2 Tax=Faecalibaculum rodentium TaxID=1702221 RepID=UPI0025771843|nr:glycosyltransferase [Faecalibaculum rodentium]